MSLEASRQLVERLRQPDCYPHAVDRVELRETHISWVLLTGRFAYKIKKPIKLDFLDFSTLERRRFFCEEELRLNQRFAPELYLDVVPVHGPRSAPRIGDSAPEPIEYAVRLRQFASDDEARVLLERNALSVETLDDLGRRLADLHACAASTDEFGSAQQTQAVVTANVKELAPLLHDEHEPLACVSTWVDARFRRLSPLIEARRHAGRVRECHGDLHAGNVVRLNGVLTPFDCIEFDPALRFIDVINDSGFLAMDLIARGHASLSYAFINGWLESSGDYDGVPLLRLFEVYRALVRAKVAALAKNDAEMRRYLSTAQNLCAERKPHLIVTCGLSGSGKTWLSTRLMTALNALRIRSDVERKRMAGLKSNQSSSSLRGQDIYTLEFNQRVYGRLLDAARAALSSGEHFIVDAAFLKRAERESFIELADELNATVSVVRCTAPPDVLRERLTRRQATGNDASEADVAVMERQIKRWEPFSERERPHLIEIDTSMPDPVGRAVDALSGPPISQT